MTEKEFPEWKENFEVILKRYQNFVSSVENAHQLLFSENDKYKFAKAAKKYPFYGVLFECQQKQMDYYKYFATYHFGKLYTLIKKTEQIKK